MMIFLDDEKMSSSLVCCWSVYCVTCASTDGVRCDDSQPQQPWRQADGLVLRRSPRSCRCRRPCGALAQSVSRRQQLDGRCWQRPGTEQRGRQGDTDKTSTDAAARLHRRRHNHDDYSHARHSTERFLISLFNRWLWHFLSRSSVLTSRLLLIKDYLPKR